MSKAIPLAFKYTVWDHGKITEVRVQDWRGTSKVLRTEYGDYPGRDQPGNYILISTVYTGIHYSGFEEPQFETMIFTGKLFGGVLDQIERKDFTEAQARASHALAIRVVKMAENDQPGALKLWQEN